MFIGLDPSRIQIRTLKSRKNALQQRVVERAATRSSTYFLYSFPVFDSECIPRKRTIGVNDNEEGGRSGRGLMSVVRNGRLTVSQATTAGLT